MRELVMHSSTAVNCSVKHNWLHSLSYFQVSLLTSILKPKQGHTAVPLCILWQRYVDVVLQLLDAGLHPDESSYGIGLVATNPHPVTIVWVPDA